MADVRKAPRRTPRRTKSLALPQGTTLALRSAPIQQRIAQLLELHQRSNRADTAARVTMGALLREIRDGLEKGDWLDWLASDVPFTPRSAQMYIRLHVWALQNQAVYNAHASLGPSKLYLLTALSRADLRTLTRRKIHAVPSSGEKRTLAGMTVRELAEVIAALTGQLDEELPADQALASYRRQVRALVEATEALVTYADLPHDELVDLHDALVQAADQLADAFALEP